MGFPTTRIGPSGVEITTIISLDSAIFPSTALSNVSTPDITIPSDPKFSTQSLVVLV